MNEWMQMAQNGADSKTNQWLNDNPIILGMLALLIGAVLAQSGLRELRKGVARDKYGNKMTGGYGKFVSILRIVIGVGSCGFGLYKIIAG